MPPNIPLFLNAYDLENKLVSPSSVYCASQSYGLRIDEKQLPDCFKVICSTNNIIRLPLLGAKEMDWLQTLAVLFTRRRCIVLKKVLYRLAVASLAQVVERV